MKRLLFILLFLLPIAAQAGFELDSLKTALQKAKGGERIDILNRLSHLNHDKNPKEALFYAREAIKYASSSGDKERLSMAYINAGVVLRNTGQSDKALEYFFNAVEITQTLNLRHIQADAIHKISVAYLLVRDFENALKYGEEEVAIWKDLKDNSGLAKALNSMGLIYLNIKRKDEALAALQESLKLGEAIGDKDLVFKPLINLGDLYISTEQFDKAINYLEKAKHLSEELDNSFGVTGSLLKIGESYFRRKEYDKAITEVQKAKTMAQELHSLAILRNAYKSLGDIYEADGQYKLALEYNRLYISTEDSMLNEITKRKIAQIEAKYEINQMEQEVERMNREASYNHIRTFFVVMMLLLGGGLAVVLINRRQIKKRNAKEIRHTASMVEEQEKKLEALRGQIADKDGQMVAVAQYISQMQSTLLYTAPPFLNIFPDHFLLQRSKEIASGDCCWFFHQNDSIVMALADCGGKGVEASFNALVLHSMLTQIASETQYRTPADLLKELDRKISRLQNGSMAEGVRIAVCAVNINNKRLTYASANMPLYLMNEGEIKVVQPDNLLVDDKQHRHADAFNNQMVSLRKGDRFFLFTKGFAAQHGGPEGKPYSDAQLLQTLQYNTRNSLPQIKETLEHQFEDWKGLTIQTDDMLAFALQL